MTKAEMMDELGDVFTDRRVTPALVEQALSMTQRAPVPILDEYLALTSGGSSGRRGVFVFDRRALIQFVTSLTRSLVARLTAQGGPPPGGLRIAMVGAPSAVHATCAAEELTAGPSMPFHFLGVPATLALADIVDRLNELDAPALAGYPTILARLARERRAGRLRITPRTISSTSETLSPALRAAISEGFGAPIVDMFGSTEGLVGISSPDDPVLVFNNDVCITELVDERNRPVPPGTPSAKVLLTNLSNRMQPLIRYEINDSFVRQPDAREHGHLRATVMGRSDEVLRWEGIEVHPIVVRSILVKSPDVIDYQVRQTDRGIDVTRSALRRWTSTTSATAWPKRSRMQVLRTQTSRCTRSVPWNGTTRPGRCSASSRWASRSRHQLGTERDVCTGSAHARRRLRAGRGAHLRGSLVTPEPDRRGEQSVQMLESNSVLHLGTLQHLQDRFTADEVEDGIWRAHRGGTSPRRLDWS